MKKVSHHLEKVIKHKGFPCYSQLEKMEEKHKRVGGGGRRKKWRKLGDGEPSGRPVRGSSETSGRTSSGRFPEEGFFRR